MVKYSRKRSKKYSRRSKKYSRKRYKKYSRKRSKRYSRKKTRQKGGDSGKELQERKEYYRSLGGTFTVNPGKPPAKQLEIINRKIEELERPTPNSGIARDYLNKIKK